MALIGTELVEKSNELNEVRINGMTLQQLRFFSIYLAKINARDIDTRTVRFSLEDFRKIMNLGKFTNIRHFQMVTNGLLCKVINTPIKSGGYRSFQLFKECTLDKDGDGEWFIEIDAHERALPFMFDLKGRYFKYQLWNALRLNSTNQLLIYELLKQHQKAGKLEISVKSLQDRLELTEEYKERWDNFKVRVLEACRKALTEITDLTFTYERGKTGKGGKWLTIIFYIKKNDDYIDQLTLDEFIELQDESEFDESEFDESEFIEEEQVELQYDEHLRFIAEACDYEFNNIEMQMISAATVEIRDEIKRFDFLREQYYKMLRRATDKQSPLHDRFKYLMGIIKNEVEKRV